MVGSSRSPQTIEDFIMPLQVDLEKKKPEIYMPGLQLLVRFMLVSVTALYLNFSPLPPLLTSLSLINLIVAGYFIFHLCWWLYYRRYGANYFMIRLGVLVDNLAAAMALLWDPYTIPPTIGLLLIAALGNGIQHGFRIFIECMSVAFIIGVTALIYHFFLIESPPPYNLYLYVFLIIFAVFYSYLLVRRLEQMKTEAVKISEHDSLTGIMNRRAFIKAAKYLLNLNERTHIPLVFIFADLDNFKAVNDRFGHEMGDHVLLNFSQTVKSRLRKNDIIARYGGDEFVMILTNISLENAKPVLERIQDEFKQWAQDHGLPVGVSFGTGTTLEGENDLDEIIRRVDAALYEAKSKARHNR